MGATTRAGVSAAEIARFDALADRWWDRRGPMRELHRMNPARTRWVGERIANRFARPVRMLDIGCGAGIAAEAFARQGHDVLGLDAAAGPIAAARRHGAAIEALSYRVGSAEELVAEGALFDVVTALEVIEHVPDQPSFLRLLSRLLVPGGLLFVSTLNRTARSYAVAVLGAEYVVRLVPRGTHDWRRFVTPAELDAAARGAGLRLADIAGLRRDPFGGWSIGRDTGINYIAMAEAAALRG